VLRTVYMLKKAFLKKRNVAPTKTGVMLHPYLPITPISLQRPHSSVPKVAVVKRFDCIYFSSLNFLMQDSLSIDSLLAFLYLGFCLLLLINKCDILPTLSRYSTHNWSDLTYARPICHQTQRGRMSTDYQYKLSVDISSDLSTDSRSIYRTTTLVVNMIKKRSETKLH